MACEIAQMHVVSVLAFFHSFFHTILMFIGTKDDEELVSLINNDYQQVCWFFFSFFSHYSNVHRYYLGR